MAASAPSGPDEFSADGNGPAHYMLYTPLEQLFHPSQRRWARFKDLHGSGESSEDSDSDDESQWPRFVAVANSEPHPDNMPSSDDERLNGEKPWQCPEEECTECGAINHECHPTCPCYSAPDKAKWAFGSRSNASQVLNATWPAWISQGGWRHVSSSSKSALTRLGAWLANAKQQLSAQPGSVRHSMAEMVEEKIPEILRDPGSGFGRSAAWDKYTGDAVPTVKTVRFADDDASKCNLEQLVNDYIRHPGEAKAHLIAHWKDGLGMALRDIHAIREMAATYVRNHHPPLTPYHAYHENVDPYDPFHVSDTVANSSCVDKYWIPVDATYQFIYVQQWVKTRDEAASLVHLAGANVIFFNDQRQPIRLPPSGPFHIKCCPALTASCYPLSKCCGQVVDGSDFDDEEAMDYRSVAHLGPRHHPPLRRPVSRLKRWLWGNQPRDNLNINDAFGCDTNDANLCQFNSHLRMYMWVRSGWADDIIRAHTLDVNGWVPGDGSKKHGFSSVSHTRVEAVATRIQLPTEGDILLQLGGVNYKPRIDRHAFVAHARFLVQREIVSKFNTAGLFLYNLSLSGTSRDSNVSGGARPMHTLKDFAHHSRAMDIEQDHPVGQFNKTPYPMLPGYTDVVYLSIDDLVYHDIALLEQLSGSPMVFWTSFYPELCGAITDCTYYCAGLSGFTEVVGNEQCNYIYPKQRQWNFMASDIVAIEALDKSKFTVYRVRVTPRPELLKQLVVLAPIHTVNLPLAVVEKLIQSTKSHPFLAYARDGRIPKFGPCDNIVVSRGIVIMRNGTPRNPTLCFMFEGNTDPGGCLSIPESVFRWLFSLHKNTGGRKLTAAEFNRRLIAYINDPLQCSDEEKQMADHLLPVKGAAFVELMKAIASYDGILPNICYYVSLAERDAAPAATDMEHDNAKAVGAAPSIVPGNPNHVVQDANASKTVKEKADAVCNKVRYSKEWKRINEHVIGRICTYMSEQTGFAPHSVTLQDREEVLDKRPRPAQVARENTAANGPLFNGGIGVEKELGETNVKGETLHRGKPAPRSVNNPPYNVSIESGRLAMALDPILKSLHCYDPGQNPQGVGDGLLRVYTMGIAAERQSRRDTHPDKTIAPSEFVQKDGRDGRCVAICCNDYTNADLLHSEDSYMVVEIIIKHFFDPAHRNEALQIYRSTFNMIMQCGPYQRNSKWTNCSGTGITTILNTCVFMVRDILITLVAYVFRSMEMHGDLNPGTYILDRRGNEIRGPPPKLTYDMFIKHLDRVSGQQRDLFKSRLDTHTEGDREFFPRGDIKLSEVLHKNGKPFYKNDLIRYVWRHVGCFFGDDSVRSAYPYIGILRVKVAMHYVGLQDGMHAKLDAVCVPSNEDSIEYLSRHFFALHAGSAASYCKIEKALAKLTVSSARDPWRYVSKLLGYISADWRAPLVGAYLRAVCSMYGLKVTTHAGHGSGTPHVRQKMIVADQEGKIIDHPYGEPDKLEEGLKENDPAVMRLFTIDRDLYYKLLHGSYPWKPGDDELAYEHAAKMYGINSVELREFDQALGQQCTWADIKRYALPGTLNEFAPCAYWPEHSCNKWMDVVEPLTVGSCDYGRRHPDDAPNTTRVYPFSTMVFGLDPNMIDWDDQNQIDKLQSYVASCSGSTPPASNDFPRQLVSMVKPDKIPNQLNDLFGIKTEAPANTNKGKGKKLFKTEAEAIEVANTMRDMLDVASDSQGSSSQDQKTTTNPNTTTKNSNTKNKKQKTTSTATGGTPASSSK